MFTGIVSQIGTVLRHENLDKGLEIKFARPLEWNDLIIGESINTNGACLTVAEFTRVEYVCYLMAETLTKTTFGSVVPKSVNLERAMSTGDRFGGHFVTGHVDGIGTILQVMKTNGWDMQIRFDPEFRILVIKKGSVTIDGVALTVTEVGADNFWVSLIPHTLEVTTLNKLEAGDKVNLEFDMIGKYVENIMEARKEDAKV